MMRALRGQLTLRERLDRTDLARDRGGDPRLACPQRGERRNTMRQKDVILSVGTVALIVVAVGVAVTGRIDEFAAWAWARHHNVLSWYIRPLFLLPFCYFAYKRSLWGITLTVVALATSMFWFPAPERADPGAAEFLAVEREYLTSDWSLWKVLLGLIVPASFAALAVPCLQRPACPLCPNANQEKTPS